jgi:hypothetical protein
MVPYVNRSARAIHQARDSKLSAWLGRANARPSVAMIIEEMAAPLLSIADAAGLEEKGAQARIPRSSPGVDADPAA